MTIALSPIQGSAGDLVEVATPQGNTPTRCMLVDVTGAVGPAGPAGPDGATGPTGPAGSTQLGAADFDEPNNADWAVPVFAVIGADSINAMMVTRRFSDAAELGLGFDLPIPAGATSLTLSLVWRAQIAPGGAVGVQPALYRRQIPNNAALPAWSAALVLAALAVPTNTNWQYSSETIALATLGLTAGLNAFFELTRQPTAAGDTLVGDWDLYRAVVTFT
jgi:hypothetical protein